MTWKPRWLAGLTLTSALLAIAWALGGQLERRARLRADQQAASARQTAEQTRQLAQDTQQRLAEHYLKSLEEQTALIKRIRHRTGEGLPGLSQADLDAAVAASKFALEALGLPELQGNELARGRLHLLLAMSAWTLGSWDTARENAVQGAAELSRSVADSDGAVRVEAAAAGNLLACLWMQLGNPRSALQACQAAAAGQADPGAAVQEHPDLAWERTLALRSQAILLAATGQPATLPARQSLEQARKLYDALPDDRGVFRWNLPHFILDAWQLLVLLQYREGQGADAARTAELALREMLVLEPEFRRVTGQRQQGLRVSKLNLTRRFLSTAARAAASEPSSSGGWPAIERRPGRTLHPDVLVNGRMRGEFTEQQAVCLAWTDEDWAHPALSELAAKLSGTVDVRVLVADAELQQAAESTLSAAGVDLQRLRFARIPTDTIWIRDYGPHFLQSGQDSLFAVDALQGRSLNQFRILDEAVAGRLAQEFGQPLAAARIILEGGHLLVDGDGLCLVSRSMIQRNVAEGVSAEHVLKTLQRLTGAETIIPLEPLGNERTGHLDLFATFTGERTLVLGACVDAADPNARLLDEHAARLDGLATPRGKLQVVRIPMPPQGPRGEWLGRTYTNVVYANQLLLAPAWSGVDAAVEAAALDVYRRLLPNRRIETIACDALGLRGGALRCATINIPSGVGGPPPGGSLRGD